MLVVKILVIAISLIIFIEDMLSRAVHWFLFPLLAVMLVLIRYYSGKYWIEILQSTLFNFSFLLLQLVILTLWFSFKKRKFVNITNEMLGLGDILFLLSLTVYLSLVNYLLFYIGSLIVVLVLWFIIKRFQTRQQHIPLAGLQALLFAFLFVAEWLVPALKLTNDYWLINKIR